MTKRFYDSVRWRKVRLMFLKEHTLCVICERMGKITEATTVDHIEPHNGDYDIFWNKENWQSLCATCHGIKRRQDHGKLLPGCDKDGLPLDSKHHWRKEK